MKLLITGGAGYIGTVLTKHLVPDHEISKIIIYDNLSRSNYNLFLGERFPGYEKIEFMHHDILDLRKLREVLKGVDAVIHLAARVTTPFSNMDSHYHEQVNHWGTSELVSAIEEGKHIKKFIYTSSTSVYGASDDFVDEGSLPNPQTFYGISKLRGEKHVLRLHKKMDAYTLRCGNVYGFSRSMRFDAVINKFMFEANFGHKISIHGNGKQYRAFVNVLNLVKVLKGILFTNVPSGVYNIVDKNLQVLDIVDVLKEIYPELEFIFINNHLQLRQLRVDDNSKLRNYIDYENKKDLKAELLDFKEKFSF